VPEGKKNGRHPRTAVTSKGTEMTDTITTDAQHDDTAVAPAVGTIEHLDPHTLVLDTNVRDEADLDAEFIASIKEHGVLIPIAAIRASDGQLRVRAGQRRTPCGT
jgi:ParB family transcriptional regulator, chromosome partitioning protein